MMNDNNKNNNNNNNSEMSCSQKMTWADVSAALRAGATPSSLLPLARSFLTTPVQTNTVSEENYADDPNEKENKIISPITRMYQKIPGSNEIFQLVYLRPPLSLFEDNYRIDKGNVQKKYVFDNELDFCLLEEFQPRFIKEFDCSTRNENVMGGKDDEKKEWKIFETSDDDDDDDGDLVVEDVGMRDQWEEKEVSCRDDEKTSLLLSSMELVKLGREMWSLFVEPAVKNIVPWCHKKNDRKVDMKRYELARKLEKWQWGVIFCDWNQQFGPLSVEVITQCLQVMNCKGLADFIITGALPFVIGHDDNYTSDDNENKESALPMNIKDLISSAFDFGGLKNLSAKRFKEQVDMLMLDTFVPVGPHVKLFLYIKYAQALTSS